MRKKGILLWSTFSIGFVGLLFAAYPFMMALEPIERIPENALEIDISNFKEYSSKLIITKKSKKIESQRSTTLEPGSSLLVVRGKDNNFYLYMGR